MSSEIQFFNHQLIWISLQSRVSSGIVHSKQFLRNQILAARKRNCLNRNNFLESTILVPINQKSSFAVRKKSFESKQFLLNLLINIALKSCAKYPKGFPRRFTPESVVFTQNTLKKDPALRAGKLCVFTRACLDILGDSWELLVLVCLHFFCSSPRQPAGDLPTFPRFTHGPARF